MQTFDLTAVDRILVGGQWVAVQPGSLREAAGVVFRRRGEIHPAYLFRTPDGTDAMVLVDTVDGYAPVSIVPAQPAGGSSMAPASAASSSAPEPEHGGDPDFGGPGPRPGWSAIRRESAGA